MAKRIIGWTVKMAVSVVLYVTGLILLLWLFSLIFPIENLENSFLIVLMLFLAALAMILLKLEERFVFRAFAYCVQATLAGLLVAASIDNGLGNLLIQVPRIGRFSTIGFLGGLSTILVFMFFFRFLEKWLFPEHLA